MPAIPTAAGASPAMAQWFAIKADHPDAILFFRMGDFYELFFADAEAAAAALDIALTSRGEHAGAPIPMCGVPVHSSELYLGRLIRRGFRVAVVEQMENPKTRTSKAPIRRAVVRLITPGTLTEDALLDAARPNLLLALAQGRTDARTDAHAPGHTQGHPTGHIDPHNGIGAAWLDVSTGLFETAALTAPEIPTLLGRLDPAGNPSPPPRSPWPTGPTAARPRQSPPRPWSPAAATRNPSAPPASRPSAVSPGCGSHRRRPRARLRAVHPGRRPGRASPARRHRAAPAPWRWTPPPAPASNWLRAPARAPTSTRCSRR